MSDHDLRRQTSEIREALSRFDREQLILILSHVFRQYVMGGEGAPLPTVGPRFSAGDYAGLSFAQVIEQLQLRLDLPELQLFEVQGGRVSLRSEGRQVPVEVPAVRPVAGAVPESRRGPGRVEAPPVSPTAATAPQAIQPPPAAAGAPAVPVSPPPAQPPVAPAGHVSTRVARPAVGSQGPVAASAAPQRPPGQAQAAAPPAPGAAGPAKDDRPTEDSGGRFALLEID